MTAESKLISLSFAEKLRILDKLRARSLAIAAAGLRDSKQEPGNRKPREDQPE